MPIAFSCGCGKSMQAKDAFAGRKLKCPGCGRVVRIPTPEEAESEEKAAPTPPPAAKPVVRPPARDEDADEAPPLARPVAKPSIGDETDSEVADEAPPLARPSAIAVADEEDEPPLARPVLAATIMETTAVRPAPNVWIDHSLAQRPTPWRAGDENRFVGARVGKPARKGKPVSLVRVLVRLVLVLAIGAAFAAIGYAVIDANTMRNTSWTQTTTAAGMLGPKSGKGKLMLLGKELYASDDLATFGDRSNEIMWPIMLGTVSGSALLGLLIGFACTGRITRTR